MKASVYNQKAEVVGDVELNSRIFEVKSNQHLVAEAARVQMSSARKGLAHTKTRAEVSGGGKKPWKQKGTGRARAGSARSPIWRHGGVTFGPRSNRNWELKINKKAKSKALFMTLSDKARDNRLIVVEKIELEQPKTKEIKKIMDVFIKNLKLGKKLVVVMPKNDKLLARSMRNLPNASTILANSLNVVDMLKVDTLLVLKDSLPVIEKTYLKS